MKGYTWATASRGSSNLLESSGGDAYLTFDSIASEASEPILVAPELNNLHEITALEDTVLLDIIAPPYKDGIRDCDYFRARKLNKPKLYHLENYAPVEFMTESSSITELQRRNPAPEI